MREAIPEERKREIFVESWVEEGFLSIIPVSLVV